MMFEVSAGIIPYYKKTKEFLLLHYPSITKGKGHWGFPKGHVEEGETEIETAKREMEEETGLDVDFVFGFKDEIKYFYKTKEGKLSRKKVVFFIGIPKSKNVKLSFEHDNYKWAKYEEALKLITFENEKRVLKRAWEFIRESKI